MLLSYVLAFAVLIGLRYALVRLPCGLRAYLDAGPWGDALTYFLQIQHYRTRSGDEPDPRCLFRGKTLHTPSCYHRFVGGWFSDALLWRAPWLPNFVLYALGLALFLALCAAAVPHASTVVVGLLVLLFAAQADSSCFDDQSVHYLTIQPRLLGALALSAHAAIFVVVSNPGLAILCGSLALMVALNTSVFSRQVAYFTLPVIALLSWSLVPVINLGAATLLSLLFNRREFIESFAAHWRYAKWYFRSFYNTRPGRGLSYWLRRTFAPAIRFVPRYADSVIALALLLMVLHSAATDMFARRATAALGAALLVCVVTALRRFASLGECWRYLSFSCYFLTPLAIVYAMLQLHIPLAAGYAAAVMVLGWNIAATLRSARTLHNPNLEILGLVQSVRGRVGQAPIWWSAHYRYGSIPVALGGGSTFEIQGTDLAEDVMARFFIKYPYLHCNDEFFDRHHVTHFLISKSDWPADVYGSLDALLRAHRVTAESTRFIILAREQP